MTSLPYQSPAHVEVDWTRESSVDAAVALMEWVQSCPEPAGIRVYLPANNGCRSDVSRMQRTLQTLGCIVTCRVAVVSHS